MLGLHLKNFGRTVYASTVAVWTLRCAAYARDQYADTNRKSDANNIAHHCNILKMRFPC
jgi:hypothetical protein